MTVGAAQLGSIQKADSRQADVAGMIVLLEEAAQKGCDFAVFPELAPTTFFPRWCTEDQAVLDQCFERDMPNAATRPLFEAAKHGIAVSSGHAELTPEGQHYNASILTDKIGAIVAQYRKIDLPGDVSRFGVEC